MSKARIEAHMAKAREFLEAAELGLEAGYPNSAASNAVTAGINAKDAMCLHALGAKGKSDRHDAAIKELSRIGAHGRQLAPTLKRLLVLKTPSQYSAEDITPAQAMKAVEWSRRMVAVAEEAVA